MLYTMTELSLIGFSNGHQQQHTTFAACMVSSVMSDAVATQQRIDYYNRMIMN